MGVGIWHRQEHCIRTPLPTIRGQDETKKGALLPNKGTDGQKVERRRRWTRDEDWGNRRQMAERENLPSARDCRPQLAALPSRSQTEEIKSMNCVQPTNL